MVMDFIRPFEKIRTEKWSRYKYNLTNGIGENGERVTGSRQHVELSHKVAAEGMVLLENNGLLPLKKGTTVALFGVGSVDYIKCGNGSGMVHSEYVRNLYGGFKSKEPRISVYEPVTKFYFDYAYSLLPEYDNGAAMPEPEELPTALICDAAKAAEVAVISIHRTAGEGYDRTPDKGDFYLTDTEEKMVADVTAAFSHSVVVLNVGGMIDTEWIKKNPKIDGALLAWQAGMEGGLAIADILCGDVNPSGKLTDTFAREFSDYPSAETFNESEDYVDYFEDIYVGYRYFETIPDAKNKVVYPFGYGLSYTEFEIAKPIASVNGQKVRVETCVKNVGKMAGKEVVQCYFSAPQGLLGKANVSLAGFKKTRLLEVGETENIVIEFPISDMSSYDDLGKLQMSAYLLEGGEYTFFVGNSCRNLVAADYRYVVEDKFVVTKQLTQKCAPNKIEKRLLSCGEYEKLPSFPIKEHEVKPYQNTATLPEREKPYLLSDVADGKITLDQFLTQLTIDELITLMGGTPSRGIANTAGFGGIKRLEIPAVMTADGPAGLRLTPYAGFGTTAFPCATLIACTWNPDLAFEVGKAGGLECKENGIAIWLTPALNIHRNPLCGRNFEYFSEDPLISGEFAAAKVNGMQSVGTAASAKHFAANNKEVNRFYSDSRMSERALREIYLRGFEICVRKSQPHTIMSSYNIINGRRCCESYEQMQGILRDEWGFQGMVTTDWSVPCDQAECVKVGNDARMPDGKPQDIRKGLEEGRIQRGHLELCAKHILEMILKLD